MDLEFELLEFEEHASEGARRSQMGSPEVSAAFVRATARVAALMVNPDDTLTLEAEALQALRSYPDRMQILQELVGSLCPPEIAVGHWQEWLTGGAEPVGALKFAKPTNIDRSTGKVLDRADKARVSVARRVAQARKKVDAAQDALRQAETDAAKIEANEKAALFWTITDSLLATMQPAFALGPAWTIMRAISSHLGAEEVGKIAAAAFDEEDRMSMMAQAIRRKQESSDHLLEVLDTWCGDPNFERDVRAALLAVTKKYDGKLEDPSGGVYKRRSKVAARRTVQTNGLKDSAAVLDGLRK